MVWRLGLTQGQNPLLQGGIQQLRMRPFFTSLYIVLCLLPASSSKSKYINPVLGSSLSCYTNLKLVHCPVGRDFSQLSAATDRTVTALSFCSPSLWELWPVVKVPKSVSCCTVEDGLTLADAWSDLPESITLSSFPTYLQILTLHWNRWRGFMSFFRVFKWWYLKHFWRVHLVSLVFLLKWKTLELKLSILVSRLNFFSCFSKRYFM